MKQATNACHIDLQIDNTNTEQLPY